jgi:hypothetical protein
MSLLLQPREKVMVGRARGRLRRRPFAALTYLLTQTATSPLSDIGKRLRIAGFIDVVAERIWGGSFVIAHGFKAPP